MKLKTWFTYAGRQGFYTCVMVLENGWIPFEHICSHPNFAPGDLFFGRKERMLIFKAMGIEVDVQPGVIEEKDIPPEVLQRHHEKLYHEEFTQKYNEIKNSMIDKQPFRGGEYSSIIIDESADDK